MVDKTAEEIHAAVSASYGARASAVARGDGAGCCGESPATGARERFYAADGADELPDSVVSYGCGNPVAIAGLQQGEVVLDLGSGAGLDCFLAAQQVGSGGRAIGVDMTDEMLALAESNKRKLGATNVEFHKGMLESLPLEDESVDVIISNCVVNLSPDKDAVLGEAFRVLRPGGRLHISDVVLLHDLSADEQADLELWAGCVAGALEREDYARRLSAAGFLDPSVELQRDASEPAERAWSSALITADKPGPRAARAPRWTGETLELIAPAGLEAGSCCDSGCCSG